MFLYNKYMYMCELNKENWGYPFSYVENIHHQYVLILQKPKNERNK